VTDAAVAPSRLAAPLACHAEAYGEGGRGAYLVSRDRKVAAAFNDE
jgi:hypothetical protein